MVYIIFVYPTLNNEIKAENLYDNLDWNGEFSAQTYAQDICHHIDTF